MEVEPGEGDSRVILVGSSVPLAESTNDGTRSIEFSSFSKKVV